MTRLLFLLLLFCVALLFLVGCNTPEPTPLPEPTPEPPVVVHPPPPSPINAWVTPLACNFLAPEGYSFAEHGTIPYNKSLTPLGYASWTTEERAVFRASYIENGYNALPVTFTPMFPDWRDVDTEHIDTITQEIRDDGLLMMSFLVTDREGEPMSYEEAVRWAQYLIPRIDGPNVIHVAIWEAPLSITSEDWTNDDFLTRDFIREIEAVTDSMIAAHLRPGWWGGAGWGNGNENEGYEDEPQWLRAHKEAGLDLMLHQSRWPAPAYDDLGAEGNGQLFWLLDYEGPRPQNPGILGRVIYEEMRIAWFEFERETALWHEKKDLFVDAVTNRGPYVWGYC